MELIYSVRRKPIKCEPPHYDGTTDPEIVRPICKISICNIIAFSSLTELNDCDGDTWGGHVYVCDLDTPWDSHKVTSTIHPVSALEWDGEGKQLLVATTVGEVSVFGQKDFLLNEWTCLYSASFPGEHIIAATFFHNGRRIVVADKKPDAPICERIQQLRPAPTLKGFGGAACAGALVVSGSGLVGALAAGDGAALVSAAALRAARDRVTAAHVAHKNGPMLVAAAYRRGARRGVRCARVSLSRTGAPRSAPAVITLSPLPTVYLGDDICPASISWWIRDEGDCLLIAGNNLTLWKLTERSYPVHKLLSKGPVQGSTTPGGGPKTNDCFNTLVWQQSATWQLEGTERASHVVVAPHALSTAVVVTPRALHLLARDTPHYLICRPIVTSGAIAPEVSSGAGTPPKKPKYGPGALPGGAGGADVWCAAVSALGGAVLALDARAQLYVYKLHGAAADVPTALSVQHVTSLLEYSMVSGYDSLDVLMTLKPNLIEAVYERLTENFQRQPQSFQQYYYQSWLKLRIALCSVSASGALGASGAALASLQLCCAAWAACVAALRDERLDALLDDAGDGDKNLLALEAKADLSDSTLQALQPLQALRRPLQRALHTALTALAALPASLHQMQHGYELWSDPAALAVLRRLVVAARAVGRGGDALSRPLARLAALPAHSALKADLVEECALVAGAAAARVWDALPRCCVAAPHARALPLHFEFGIEPEYLRYVPEPPAYAQSDITPALDMDSIRYMYLGGGRRRARWRQCGRCGARALPAAQPSRHPLQRAYDGRFVAACRCGGKWTLVSNV